LKEPYSIFTYRYFLWDWPDLTWVALDGERIIGSIVCEMKERKKTKRGYIAMLSVDPEYRRKGIAQDLVLQCLRVMKEAGCFMATLETEVINKNATNLYTKLGFLKDKLLVRYYLNGGDAWRLKLFFAAK
jgi:peptide alpha-N-acetyltransferase